VTWRREENDARVSAGYSKLDPSLRSHFLIGGHYEPKLGCIKIESSVLIGDWYAAKLD
jgi:hypothetical protein